MSAPYEVVCSSRDRQLWLAARRTGIGSSDAAAILGVSPYASPMSVYTDKLGLSEDRAETEAMKWGKKLEPLIIEEFGREVDRGVQPSSDLLRSTLRPWILATPDGFQAVGTKTPGTANVGVLEVKTSGYGREDWDEGIPAHVNAQIQHQMLATGMDWGTVVLLLGGQKLVWRDVERDDRFIDEILLPAEEEFWSRVTDRIPPPPDGMLSTAEALKLLYPNPEEGKTVTLTGDFIDLDLEREVLLASKKAVDAKLEEINNRLKAAIGDAETAVLSGGVKYTFKLQHRKESVIPATSFRVLRRSGPK